MYTDYSIALDFHQRFFPDLGDRYLASNVFITPPGHTNPVRFGAPFRRFTTDQGRRMLAFGTLFNFTYAAQGIHVQFMDEFVKEQWFLDELVREEVDAIILLGHVPVGFPEWTLLHQVIRRILPDTPM